MSTVGIMHSGSEDTANKYIEILKNKLQTFTIDGPYYPTRKTSLKDIADYLIQKKMVDLLIAAGGSRSAAAAIEVRGKLEKPIIVFTSVAPYILNMLDKNTTTGVCAHTSDHDVDRFDLLRKMPLRGKRIGVLRNSNRHDHAKQKQDIDDAMKPHRHTPRHRDINGPDTLKDIFDLFRGDIHGLLVAADPFFNNHREEVVELANANGYPAIYQWCEFVELGGLMSYGPSLSQCYDRAGAIAAGILNGAINPPYEIWEQKYPDDFELCVSESSARRLGMWPLPEAITAHPKFAIMA
jgi:putative ABC transport system substrate-binding protein